jgi:hypothetical protein
MNLPPLRTIVSCTLMIAGIIGASIHASTLYTSIRPNNSLPALDILISLLTAFFAAEALYLLKLPVNRCSPRARGHVALKCTLYFTGLTCVAAALSLIGFAIGFRSDAAGWCAALLASLLLVTERVRVDNSEDVKTSSSFPNDDDNSAAASISANNINNTDYSPLARGDAVTITTIATPSSTNNDTNHSISQQVSACCCASRTETRVRRALFVAHGSIWCLASVFTILLLGGAFTLASGWHRFPPRGKFYNLAALGSASISAYCVGAEWSVTSLPTIFLDFGGGGHSSSDVYGLIDVMIAAGRRICVADPPGTGHSSLGNLDASVIDQTPWAIELLTLMGETGPFTFVGSMDGGAERIYRLALAQPDLVYALVPMQLGEGEFLQSVIFRGLSNNDAIAYVKATVGPRLAFCDVIRFLGTSFGLVAAFVPSTPQTLYIGDYAAKNFLNLFHEGQWDMQCRYLAAQVRDPTAALLPSIWATNRTLAAHIRVLAIDNINADPCAGGAVTGADCALAIWATARNTLFMKSMTTMTGGSIYTSINTTTSWLGAGDSPINDIIALITTAGF